MAAPWPAYKSPNWDVPLKAYIDSSVGGGTTVAATVGDGVADDSAAINDAIEAAPDGGTVRVLPGVCRLTGSAIHNLVGGVPKSVHLQLDGVTLLNDGDHDAIELWGAFEDTFTVTELTTGLYQESSESSVEAVTIRTNVAPSGWRRGDVVKLVADDRVPYADTPVGDANQMRSGQSFTVIDATTNVIVLAGKLDFPFTTNIRAAKMSAVDVSVTGGTLDVTPEHQSTYTQPGMTFTACQRPRINRVTVLRATGAAIVLRGCFGAVVDTPRVGWAYNSPATGGNGYGIADTGSQGTLVIGPNIGQVRHAFTTGTNFLPANYASIYAYGVTYQAKVTGGVADSCTSTAWDTHPTSKDISFIDCHAANCTIGFASRSPDTTFSDISTRNCRFGMVLFQSGGGSELPNNVVRGYRSYGDTDAAIDVRFGQRDGIPTYHVQQVQPTVFRDVHIRTRGRGIAVRWGRFHIDNLTVSFDGELQAGGLSAAVVSVSSHITGGNWKIDYTESTGLADQSFLIADDSGQVSVLAPTDVLVFGTLQTRVNYVIDNPANAPLRIPSMLLSEIPALAVIKTPPSVGAWVDWETISIGTKGSVNAAFQNLGDTGLLPALTSHDVIGGNFTLTAARVYPALPSPRRVGQLMVVRNAATSAGTLTIQNGTSFKVATISGANVVLNPGETLLLLAVDAALWQQIRGI